MTMMFPAKVRAAVLAAAALGAQACGGAQSGGSSGGGGGSSFTLTNSSSASICGAEFYAPGFDPRNILDLTNSPIAPGESRTLEIDGRVNRMRLLECNSTSTLWDAYIPFNSGRGTSLSLANASATLVDDGTEVTTGSALTLVVSRRDFSEWLGTEGSLASEQDDVLTSARAFSRQSGFSGEVLRAIVKSDEYTVRTNSFGVPVSRSFQVLTHVRYPGYCMARVVVMSQRYNGGDYASSRSLEGNGDTLPVPCAILDEGGATASSSGGGEGGETGSGGGGCTNTCNSANDGDCDDGGPGSSYAVCALGTDCADCGAR